MRVFAQRPQAAQGTRAAGPGISGRLGSRRLGAVHSLVHLQRTIGNQAVQRRLHAQTVAVARDSRAIRVTPISGKAGLPDIQMSRLREIAASFTDPAFVIGDSDIEASDEFKAYMDSSLIWQWQDKVTRQEAFLACRLLIEAIRRKEPIKWETDARVFMLRARKLINITKSPKAGCPSSTLKACVKRVDIPAEFRDLAYNVGLLAGFFRMEIDWHEDDPGCACCCGEYRQLVKGFVKINGKKQTKTLFNGKTLSEADWVEDSDAANHPYGHRDLAEAVNDKFIPDRKSGCLYRGFDTPGVPSPDIAGNRVEISLHFKGQAFDRCQNTVNSEKQWDMNFKDDIPARDQGSGGGVIG